MNYFNYNNGKVKQSKTNQMSQTNVTVTYSHEECYNGASYNVSMTYTKNINTLVINCYDNFHKCNYEFVLKNNSRLMTLEEVFFNFGLCWHGMIKQDYKTHLIAFDYKEGRKLQLSIYKNMSNKNISSVEMMYHGSNMLFSVVASPYNPDVTYDSSIIPQCCLDIEEKS